MLVASGASVGTYDLKEVLVEMYKEKQYKITEIFEHYGRGFAVKVKGIYTMDSLKRSNFVLLGRLRSSKISTRSVMSTEVNKWALDLDLAAHRFVQQLKPE